MVLLTVVALAAAEWVKPIAIAALMVGIILATWATKRPLAASDHSITSSASASTSVEYPVQALGAAPAARRAQTKAAASGRDPGLAWSSVDHRSCDPYRSGAEPVQGRPAGLSGRAQQSGEL
jgi:hypothetical protein